VPFFRLAALVAALFFAAPLGVDAQQAERSVRVGILGAGTPAGTDRNIQAFRQRLRELGWIEGQNLVLDLRFVDNKYDRLPGLAADIVALKPDVFFSVAAAATVAAAGATATIPIVFEMLGDALSWASCPTSRVLAGMSRACPASRRSSAGSASS